MAFGLETVGITPPHIDVRPATLDEIEGAVLRGGPLTSEVSEADSVLYDRPRPVCNKRGVMLDRHVGNGDVCARCGERKGPW